MTDTTADMDLTVMNTVDEILNKWPTARYDDEGMRLLLSVAFLRGRENGIETMDRTVQGVFRQLRRRLAA